MTPEDADKIESLFHAALELKPEERPAFLDRVCSGDPALREELESLLAARRESPDYLEKPAWSLLASTASRINAALAKLPVEPGLPYDKLGEFRLIRRMGEGGMGVVFLAVQESLGRQVALKVIRPEHTGSLELETRFSREVEAVSSLRHPNIVTVFGSGEEKGVRYFAMELIPGKGLDDIFREAASSGEKLAIPKILGWIGEMANALEAAHQAGIIHRDIKPSNIRITPEESAMLMDFGVARQSNLATMTLTGEFRGTPHYASPEQVKAKRHKIDIRTDIYSLGVTLYQGITGRVPFEGETTEQVFHQILDRDPNPPRRLNPTISRDLDTVVTTAMEKDPNRRYQTMEEFAGDLRRILNGEMILAKPAGFPTRAGKWVRRNPGVSAAVGVGVLALISFLLYFFLWSYPQIRLERDKAKNQEIAALKAKANAEREADKTRVINKFLETMLSSADPGREGKEVKVVEVLDKAVKEIDTFFDGPPEIEASLRNTMGKTYRSLGLYPEAEAQHRAALKLSRSFLGGEHTVTLSSLNGLAVVLKNRQKLDEAETVQMEALEGRIRVLGEEHPETLSSKNSLANLRKGQGRLDEAEALHREVLEARTRTLGEEDPSTLDSLSNLANVLRAQGKFLEASSQQRKVLEVQRRVLGEEHPRSLRTMNNLAIILQCLGEYVEAETLLKGSLEIQRRLLGDGHPDTIGTMNNLALVLEQMYRYREAQVLIEEALKTSRRDQGTESPSAILSLHNLASILKRQGKLSVAESHFREVMEIWERSKGKEHPSTLIAMNGLANALLEQNKLSEAEALHEEVLSIRRRVLGNNHPDTIKSMNSIAAVLKQKRKFAAAETLYREVLDIRMHRLGEEHPDTLHTLRSLVYVLRRQEKTAEAVPLCDRGIEITRNLGSKHSVTLGILLVLKAECLIQDKDFQAAEPVLLEAHEMFNTQNKAEHNYTRHTLKLLVMLYNGWEKPERAEEYRAMLSSSGNTAGSDK